MLGVFASAETAAIAVKKYINDNILTMKCIAGTDTYEADYQDDGAWACRIESRTKMVEGHFATESYRMVPGQLEICHTVQPLIADEGS